MNAKEAAAVAAQAVTEAKLAKFVSVTKLIERAAKNGCYDVLILDDEHELAGPWLSENGYKVAHIDGSYRVSWK